MNKTMVSVVMITYGHDQFISQAIQGVLMQKCDFDIQLIIANDCSPDNTDEVVKQIFKSHPNSYLINYTKHTENKGMIANFIWALQQAEGNYIAICEGDDYWVDPLKLQKQVDFLENNSDYNIISTNAFLNRKNSQILNAYVKEDFTFNFEMQMLMNRSITCTCLFRSGQFQIGELNQYKDLKIGDLFIWSLSLRNNKLGFFLNENSAVYRIHDGGQYSQNSLEDNSLNELNVYNSLMESGMFNFSEKRKIKYKIQLIWYDILTSRDWFTKTKSFLMVTKYLDIISLKSLLLFFKGSIRVSIGKYYKFD